MKKLKLFAGFLILLFIGATLKAAEKAPLKSTSPMPENVKAIIDRSCFGCHNTDSDNEDAKKDLDFKKFDGLSTFEKIGALGDIGGELYKNRMPPKKYLERHPENMLTEDEINIMNEWIKTEVATLLKQ